MVFRSKSKRAFVIETLKILKEAGFYKQFGTLTEEEILNNIHEERRKQHSVIFGYPYEPERNLRDQELACHDTSKMLHLDLEADVCRENKVYSWLLEQLDELSGRKHLITNIDEQWDSETGPINISYRLNGEKHLYSPEYFDDWIDQTFIDDILAEITKITGESFPVCLGPNEDWFGQDVNYIRLLKDERKILENKFHWVFFDDFLERTKNKS